MAIPAVGHRLRAGRDHFASHINPFAEIELADDVGGNIGVAGTGIVVLRDVA